MVDGLDDVVFDRWKEVSGGDIVPKINTRGDKLGTSRALIPLSFQGVCGA